MKRFIALLLTFTLMGCASCGNSIVSPPLPPDTAQCGEACDKMAAMGCEEGMPVPVPVDSVECQDKGKIVAEEDGGVVCEVSCKAFCEATQASYVWLNPSCIIKNVERCEDIEPKCAPQR